VRDRGVYPRPEQDPLPVWLAVGGSPPSVVRGGTLGLPLALAIIGGAPERFRPMVDLYRASAERAGNDPSTLPVGINAHGHVGATSAAARDAFFGPYAEVMTRIGRERGWPPTARAQFDAGCAPGGHLFVGDSAEVVDKILALHEVFGHDRLLMQTVGTVPHPEMLRGIERFGTEVAPAVRKALGDAKGYPSPTGSGQNAPSE
jgi:alkanesulfonate monooxygenase SsuD/methylene tetrahydromethanopterin reductase-like flavin-dependent oxidoreductase (luciferase family)